MIKKLLFFLLVIFMLCNFSLVSFSATNIDNYYKNNSVVYFKDGSYIETIITQNTDFTVYSTNTTSGSKIVTYKDSDGVAQWSATLTGYFTYNGSSATCTSSSISYNIIDSAWKISSATATKSGSEAIGNIIAKRYFLGIPTKTVEKEFTLTCSATGVLS